MESILRIRFKGEEFSDFSFINIGEVDVDKQPEITYKMEITNPTNFTTRKMKLTSGIPDELWSYSMPTDLKEQDRQPMTITLKTAKIMESKDPKLFDSLEQKHQMLFEIEYEKVKVFR